MDERDTKTNCLVKRVYYNYYLYYSYIGISIHFVSRSLFSNRTCAHSCDVLPIRSFNRPRQCYFLFFFYKCVCADNAQSVLQRYPDENIFTVKMLVPALFLSKSSIKKLPTVSTLLTSKFV